MAKRGRQARGGGKGSAMVEGKSQFKKRKKMKIECRTLRPIPREALERAQRGTNITE